MTELNHNEHRVDLQRITSEERRRAAAQCPLIFGQLYLKERFQYEPSSMHVEIAALLKAATKKRGQKLAFAAPRGHAKTTLVSETFVLWCICFELEKYIWLLSDTSKQAELILSNIRKELESNTELRRDFPQACEVPGKTPNPRRWRAEDIVTRNNIRVSAFGATSRERGRKHGASRPTLIIADDLENEMDVMSSDLRNKKMEWFTKTVLNAGTSETDFIVVGTILHHASLLATLMDPVKSPGWDAHRYRALMSLPAKMELWGRWDMVYCSREEYEGATGRGPSDRFFFANQEAMLEGAKALWSENPGEDVYPLMKLRAQDSRAFSSEKQNEPTNPEDCDFPSNYFHYWDDEFDSVEQLLRYLGRRASFYGACDPSLGKSGRRGDYTAIITIVKDDDSGVMYVIDVVIERLKPDETIDEIIACARRWDYQYFVIETNQFQQFFADTLEKQALADGVRLDIERVTQTKDKHKRIPILRSHMRPGHLKFWRRHTLLDQQMREFPNSAHDDGPDALEMAVAQAIDDRYLRARFITARG